MLRIEEIVGAMDDEFRFTLEAFDDVKLAELAANKAALRRLRPVGVSQTEAIAMIAAIQERRAAQARYREKCRRRQEAAGARRARRTPFVRTAPPSRPVAPAILPPPPSTPRLAPPVATGPAIRLRGPDTTATRLIILPPPCDEPAKDQEPEAELKLEQEQVPTSPRHRPWGITAIIAGLAAALTLWAWVSSGN